MIPTYPKIFQIGETYISNIFDSEVEITEKVDGSMFAFGIDNTGAIVMRSKGKELFMESHEKMFKKAVDFVIDRQTELLKRDPNTYFYGEYLEKPKHNTLAYASVPKNNIALFGVCEKGIWQDYENIRLWSIILDCDVVPLLATKIIKSKEDLDEFHQMESYLGNQKVEGVVIKNYKQVVLIGGHVYPVFAKYVRPEFKEVHNKEWTSGKDKVQDFIDGFKTDARWNKAIIHLQEDGLLENSPKDIGKLIVEIQKDLFEEEETNIKQGLFDLFKAQISRKATTGFPEYYKAKLLGEQFEV